MNAPLRFWPIQSGYDIGKDGVTQSMLAGFLQCRMKYLYRINGWRRKKTGFRAADFGSICHDAFDFFYSNLFKKDIRSRLPLIDRTMLFVRNYKSGNPVLDISQEMIEGKALAEAVLYEYFVYYHGFHQKIEAITEVEKVFDVNYRGIRLRGKRDLAYSMNGFWIMEHKTKGRINDVSLGQRLSFDLQNMFYLLSAEIEYKTKLSGVVYNIIRTPQLRKQKNEKMSVYIKRVKEDVRSRPEFYFIRYEVAYTQKDRDIFAHDLANILLEAGGIQAGRFPVYCCRVTCEMPFPCEYLELCATGSLTNYEISKLFSELEEENGSQKTPIKKRKHKKAIQEIDTCDRKPKSKPAKRKKCAGEPVLGVLDTSVWRKKNR